MKNYEEGLDTFASEVEGLATAKQLAESRYLLKINHCFYLYFYSFIDWHVSVLYYIVERIKFYTLNMRVKSYLFTNEVKYC